MGVESHFPIFQQLKTTMNTTTAASTNGETKALKIEASQNGMLQLQTPAVNVSQGTARACEFHPAPGCGQKMSESRVLFGGDECGETTRSMVDGSASLTSAFQPALPLPMPMPAVRARIRESAAASQEIHVKQQQVDVKIDEVLSTFVHAIVSDGRLVDSAIDMLNHQNTASKENNRAAYMRNLGTFLSMVEKYKEVGIEDDLMFVRELARDSLSK